MRPRVIVLNGVGKSSTAKAFQAIADDPFLLLQMDGFFDMLPEAIIGHPDGVTVAADESAAQKRRSDFDRATGAARLQ